MYKQIGAIQLVAGTCIGRGMIARPMVLAKLGLIPSILFMVIIGFIMYYTSLVNRELNLQGGHGLSLGALGKCFSVGTAELIGTISLKLLSYSLLAVFIYGELSLLKELIESKMAAGKAEVGELIQVLSGIAKWQSVQLLVWGISILPLLLQFLVSV